MNTENLHELINRYEAGLDETMNPVHHEQMKWEAVKIFRNAWFPEEAQNMPFADMFNRARKGCGVVIDNASVSPTSGVVRMAQAEPETVKSLFNDVLFADDGGDIAVRQEHMDEFIDRINDLRLRLFPRNWKYAHERHAASCYLAFFAPESNYIYRASDANMMAKYIEFGKPIGTGKSFSLPAYYEMCDAIVEALKEHPSLLAAHKERLDSNCWQDDSLHLMAFDLMYCSRCYGYYHGLTYFGPLKKTGAGKASKQKAANDQKRQELTDSIRDLQDQLLTLQMQLAEVEPVSLLDTEVTVNGLGTGIIVGQEENKITVRFGDQMKDYMIHRKYASRPVFEDDEQIVELMSSRVDLLEQIEKINKQTDWKTKMLGNL